jgi:hypothetical protein
MGRVYVQGDASIDVCNDCHVDDEMAAAALTERVISTSRGSESNARLQFQLLSCWRLAFQLLVCFLTRSRTFGWLIDFQLNFAPFSLHLYPLQLDFV